MSTVTRALQACAVAGYLAGGGCLSADEARSGDLFGPEMSAHDCWVNYLQAALDAGAADSADWPPECADYLDRLTQGPCAEALARVCGADLACEASPACASVHLMAEFVDGRERCQAALDDPARYPDCHAINDCDVLVARTCGEPADGALPCRGRPACEQALLLQADALNPQGLAVCAQALQESTLYPRCEL